MTSPSITISTHEYLALQSAADLLRERAAQLAADGIPAALVENTQQIASRVQDVHDRWHRAAVAAAGTSHHPCEWCSNATEQEASQ